MKRAPLFLVACVSKKRRKLLPAEDLYCSDWFLKARAYVEKRGGRGPVFGRTTGPRQDECRRAEAMG